MDGLTILRRARDAGLAVVAEGDKLVIRGPKRAEPVALLLIQHKPEVLAALAPVERKSRRWRDRYAARISHWFLHGRRRWQDAEALAYGELLNEWHLLHCQRRPQSRCAGCDGAIADGVSLCLADGNRVHFEAIGCLLQYGKHWRCTAVAALRTLGLEPPPGFEPIDAALANGACALIKDDAPPTSGREG